MNPMRALLSSIILSIAVCASAQTLTIKEARALALQHNHDLAKSAAQREQAQQQRLEARSHFFPRLDASANGVLSTADDEFSLLGNTLGYDLHSLFSAGISLQQPLFMGGKILASYRMATLYRGIAEQQELLTQTEVIVRTDEAYTQVVRAGEMVEVAEAYRQLLTELERQVDAALRQGMAVRNDLLKVQVKGNEAELALTQANNALRLARMNLCHVIGLPLDSLVTVSHDFAQPEMLLTQANLDERPEAIIMDQQLAITEQQVRIQRSEWLPQLALMGAFNYVKGGKVAGKTLFDKSYAAAGLSLSLPLFTGGERLHALRQAKAQKRIAAIEQTDVDEQLRLDFAQAANQLDEAQLEVFIAQKSLDQAAENLALTRRQYDVGLETLSELLDAQALWQECAAGVVDAKCQLLLANTRYLKAAGLLIPNEL